jgi:hypothetical protein
VIGRNRGAWFVDAEMPLNRTLAYAIVVMPHPCNKWLKMDNN